LTIYDAYNNFSFNVKTNELPFIFMVHIFWDEVNFQPTFFGTFEIMIFFHDEQARFYFILFYFVGEALCCNGQFLLTIGVQFPHIVLSPQIGNKKPFVHIKLD
jgi:hypothetical protein